MTYKSRPFQRAKMMQLAATLEGIFGEANASAIAKLDEAQALKMSETVRKGFHDRAEAMEECRYLMSQVRSTVFYSK